jgi:hypothetical protein
VKYLILIYGNPRSRAIWDGFSDEQRAEGFQVYASLNEDLASSGELIACEALADPSLGRRVPARVQLDPLDGPFAEVKEQLAGFYLVQCDDMERALEIAGRMPESEFGLVEVRPVMDLTGLEM